MVRIRAIIGPPGCGKTTAIAAEVRRAVSGTDDPFSVSSPYERRTRAPAVVCSFTRAAASEAAGRDTGLAREQIGTLHAFAYRALDRPTLVAGKESDFNESIGRSNPAWRLSAGMATTDDPLAGSQIATTPGDRFLAEYGRLRCRMVDRSEWSREARDAYLGGEEFLRWTAAYETWKNDAGLLDFHDLLEVAARDVLTAHGNPRQIWMDEAQDTSRLALHLARRWAASCEGLTIVGDPWQALYAPWAGAYPEMFASEKIDTTIVLEQSHRVPRAPHARAVEWVKQLSTYRPIRYAPRDAEGEVRRCSASHRSPARILSLIPDLEGTVMIQATCDYHLGQVIKMLRERGIPYANPWRRTNGRWNPIGSTSPRSIVGRLRALLSLDGTWTYKQVDLWAGAMLSKQVLQRGAKKQMQMRAQDDPEGFVLAEDLARWFDEGWIGRLLDRLVDENRVIEAAEMWVERLPVKSRRHAAYVMKILAARQLDNRPRVFVGTIHSFKGAEADNVFIFPDLSPSAASGLSRVENRDAMIRAGYVAMTRTRDRLFICDGASPYIMHL